MNINRRTVLLGLSAAGVGAGAAFGSGAFTSVTADRAVQVDVTSDDAGLITITGDYVTYTADGVAEFGITDADLANAQGLNPEATTTFEDVLTLSIEDAGNQPGGTQYTVMFKDSNNLTTDGLQFTVNTANSDGTVITDSNYPLEVQDVEEGQSVVLDIEIDSTGDASGDSLSGDLGIDVQKQ